MSDHWYSNPTQIYFACRALALGQTLNHMDVIGETRGWRLGAIVHTLKHEYDWPIRTDLRGPERIGHYTLEATCDPLTLRLPPSAQRLAEELRDLHEAADGRARING